MKHIEVRINSRVKSRRVHTSFSDPSLADDSQREDSDVNVIVQRHMTSGIPLPSRVGSYEDVSNIPNLLEAYEQVKLASEAFQALPAKLRAKLENDPRNLPKYLQDPANKQEAIEYGLFNKTQAPVAPSVPTKASPAPNKKTKNNDESNDDE